MLETLRKKLRKAVNSTRNRIADSLEPDVRLDYTEFKLSPRYTPLASQIAEYLKRLGRNVRGVEILACSKGNVRLGFYERESENFRGYSLDVYCKNECVGSISSGDRLGYSKKEPRTLGWIPRTEGIKEPIEDEGGFHYGTARRTFMCEDTVANWIANKVQHGLTEEKDILTRLEERAKQSTS